MKSKNQIAVAVSKGYAHKENARTAFHAALDAIERDRRQRNLVGVVAEALEDRGVHSVAELVRDTDPDDLWSNYLGPMLDQLEDDYTRLAKVEEFYDRFTDVLD